jgi:hypothetical protein
MGSQPCDRPLRPIRHSTTAEAGAGSLIKQWLHQGIASLAVSSETNDHASHADARLQRTCPGAGRGSRAHHFHSQTHLTAAHAIKYHIESANRQTTSHAEQPHLPAPCTHPRSAPPRWRWWVRRPSSCPLHWSGEGKVQRRWGPRWALRARALGWGRAQRLRAHRTCRQLRRRALRPEHLPTKTRFTLGD